MREVFCEKLGGGEGFRATVYGEVWIVTAVYGAPQALGKGAFSYLAMDTAMDAIVWRPSLK